jgi:hypothetical protein
VAARASLNGLMTDERSNESRVIYDQGITTDELPRETTSTRKRDPRRWHTVSARAELFVFCLQR